MNVKSQEGIALSETYFAGNSYPVFVLADSSGEVVTRWTGYTGAERFVRSLGSALSIQVTIRERLSRLEMKPTLQDALFLAEYYAEIEDYLGAAGLYRKAQALRKDQVARYSYDVFGNMAAAAWNGRITFDQVIPAADDVLVFRPDDVSAVSGVARVISNLARRLGKTERITKYLQAGIDATDSRTDPKSRETHSILEADRVLYADGDTALAISIRKEGLGRGWENNPEKFYLFAKWCLERKIALQEAETYASQAAERSSAGKFRASVLNTLADVYDARGKTTDAIRAVEMALEQDPSNDAYVDHLRRLKETRSRGQ